MKVSKILLAISAIALLAGCQGGGQESSSVSSSAKPTPSSEVTPSVSSEQPVSSSEAPVGFTLTATCEQDWAFKTQIPIFAWVWGGQDTGSWIKVEFTASETLREVNFAAPETTEHFLLVRCSEGTETPDWEKKSGDEAGRIYNKTGDVDLQSGVFTYAVTFVDYPGAN